ncbi:hypothetical protein V1523DRAFT_203187 [Lipomyces doorenjongii]
MAEQVRNLICAILWQLLTVSRLYAKLVDTFCVLPIMATAKHAADAQGIQTRQERLPRHFATTRRVEQKRILSFHGRRNLKYGSSSISNRDEATYCKTIPEVSEESEDVNEAVKEGEVLPDATTTEKGQMGRRKIH